jgi:hypothetical protein
MRDVLHEGKITMAIDYAFKIVGQEEQQASNVFTLREDYQDNETESSHPVLQQLKDRITDLERELKFREETLLGVQEIVDKFWDTLPDEYCKAMNDRFDN